MREFLETSTAINQNIKQLDEYTNELKKYTLLKQNSVLTEAENNALDRKIETVSTAFQNLIDKVKVAIKTNQHETMKMISNGAKKNVIEIRELHTFRQGKDLADALRRFQDVQCDYRQREKEQLKETFLIANPKATERELEMLTEGEEGEAILASAFALGSHSAQGILKQAKNRKKKIEKIVERINILVSYIDEIDRVVRQNAPTVDQVTINMVAAEEHTTQANQELSSALRYEMRVMRIKRILAFVGVCIIVGMIVYIFGDRIFSRNNGNNQN